jgi:hypothetical protein
MPRPSSDGLDNGYPQNFGGRSNNRSQPNFQQNPSGYSHDNEQQLRQRFSMVGASAPPTHSPHAGGGGGSGGMDQQGMMPNQQQQQQQQMGYSGNRHDMSGTSPNTSINAMGGGGGGSGGGGGHGHQQQYQIGDLSPTIAHRMQMNTGGMGGSSGMYQQMGNNPSPNYASAMEMDSRGLTPTGPVTGGAPTASTTPGGSLSQADREEELLLNLLIARRQRGSRMSADGGRNAQSLADELMRLRQSRSQASSSNTMGQSSRGSHMPPVPGLPPLYTEPGGTNAYLPAGNMGGGSGGGSGGAGLPSYESYVRQSSDHMMSAMQDASERIERPSRLLDARSQGQDAMRDFSGRGLKRPAHMGGSMGEFGNLKYPTAMGMQSYEVAPVKKKRTHKKKPADMPRRPLSAYNLFFSEERERILKEIDVKEGGSAAADSASKDEETVKEESATEATEGEDDADKPKALMRPLIPAQKKRRPHRKTHGKISFQQLARMVGERWKALPDDQRKYYQGLAEADMKRQKVAMEEYYAKQSATKEESKGESKEEGDNEMETEKDTEKEEKTVGVDDGKAVGVGL